MDKITFQEQVLVQLKEGAEKGLPLAELYLKFSDHLKQSVRGTVLSLVKQGKAERVSKGVYRPT